MLVSAMHLSVSTLLLVTVTSGDTMPNSPLPPSISSCSMNGQLMSDSATYNAEGRQVIFISCTVTGNPKPTVTITAGAQTVNQVDVSPLTGVNEYTFNHTFNAIDTTHSGQWIISFTNGLECVLNVNCQYHINVNVDAVTLVSDDLTDTNMGVIPEPIDSSGLIAFQTYSCEDATLCFLPSGTPTADAWSGLYVCLVPNFPDENGTLKFALWTSEWETQLYTGMPLISFPTDCPMTGDHFHYSDNPFWFMLKLHQSGGNPNTVQVTMWSSQQYVYNTPLNATNPITFSVDMPYTVTQFGISQWIYNKVIYYPHPA